jgi:hypothetical protein
VAGTVCPYEEIDALPGLPVRVEMDLAVVDLANGYPYLAVSSLHHLVLDRELAASGEKGNEGKEDNGDCL